MINLSNVRNAIVTRAQTVGTIRNDDVPNISITDVTVTVLFGGGSLSLENGKIASLSCMFYEANTLGA